MTTWTLVMILSMSSWNGTNAAALTSVVVPGYTTKQACENALRNIHPGEELDATYLKVRTVTHCSPTSI